MLPVPAARCLRHASDQLTAALRRRGRQVFRLRRRDAELGHAVVVHRQPPTAAQAARLWAAAEPVFLPGVLGDGPARHADAIALSLAMFDRLRVAACDPRLQQRPTALLTELEQRLHDDDLLRYAGSTVDRDDPRELERVFVDALGPDGEDGEPVASDLWAKLAWITGEDPSDASLRIRFSNGLDQLEEWMTTGERTASHVDRFALQAFPECRALLECAPLRGWLDLLVAQPHRLSERIIYNNAPNGGAIFHHDAEPGQLGVCFAQLEGRTAWFTLSKRRLVRLLQRRGFGRPHRIRRLLDDASDPQLLQLLNRDAGFARELMAHGALFVLEAGDAILLPSHGIDEVAWHSVLAVGDHPSLAHSYGLFSRGDAYDPVGDPWLARPTRSTTSRS